MSGIQELAENARDDLCVICLFATGKTLELSDAMALRRDCNDIARIRAKLTSENARLEAALADALAHVAELERALGASIKVVHCRAARTARRGKAAERSK